MGLFGKDTFNGLLSTGKDAVKKTTGKVSKTIAESTDGLKQYNKQSKELKAPVEGAIERYGVVYGGGLKEYPKRLKGEIGLNIMEDCFYLKPTNSSVEEFEEMAIPYGNIEKLEIVERTISNAEWLLSSGTDMKGMQQKNVIEISYRDTEQKGQLIRLEMPTGISIYGQAKKCVEFMDVLRQNGILDKFIKEQEADAKKGAKEDIISQIEKLAELKEKGILSEAEFNEKKMSLLEKI